MVALGFSALALFLASAWPAMAQADAAEELADLPVTPDLNIKITAAFPQSEVFGVKLVNGHPTQVVLSVENGEVEPVQLAIVGGSLWTPEGVPGAPESTIVRNLTTARFGSVIPGGESESFNYAFTNEMHPQDVVLRLSAIVQSGDQYLTYTFFNQTVSVVEAPLSFFDPQIIFLYLLLAGVFGGVCLFIWNTWSPTLFPQKRKGGKGGERAKKSSQGSKKVNPADQVAIVGADGPAVTSGAQAQSWSNEWVDKRHTEAPVARRVGSFKKGPKPPKTATPTSP